MMQAILMRLDSANARPRHWSSIAFGDTQPELPSLSKYEVEPQRHADGQQTPCKLHMTLHSARILAFNCAAQQGNAAEESEALNRDTVRLPGS